MTRTRLLPALLPIAALAAVFACLPASAQLFRRPARVADVAPAPIDLQALVDAAAASGQQEVRLPAGVFRLARPLVLRPSNVFGTLRLVGAGPRYNGDARFGGTELVADFDGPAVIIQGGRGSSVERLSIRGPLWSSLFNHPYPGADLAAWPGERKRYNPSCGVAVDVGSPFSEHPRILDCEIGGFECGVVTKPDGGDGNGDFLTLRQCRILHCVYGVSITHTQSRRVTVEDCTIQCVHTAVTNRDHGKGVGELDGWVRADFNQVARLCNFTQGYAGPTVFQSCYGELVGSLGNFDSGGSRTANRTVFRDCRFDLRLASGNGVIADGGGLLLDGGLIHTHDLPVVGSECDVRGTKFRPSSYENWTTFPRGRKRAANWWPLIDRPHPAKTGTGWADIASVAHFPNPDADTNYQVGWQGRGPVRTYGVWERRFVKYDPVTETMVFPPSAKPEVGDLVQHDATMTAWVVLVVHADGRGVSLSRVNNAGREIPETGNTYLVKAGP